MLCVVVIAIYRVEGCDGTFHRLQDLSADLLKPMSLATTVINSQVETIEENSYDASASPETLTEISKQNSQLRYLLAKYKEYEAQAQRLKSMLGLIDSYKLKGISSRIIGKSSNSWEQTVKLDKGENDGVQSGYTVMGPSGVIGQVISTSYTTCKVKLLVDPSSSVSVICQDSRTEGIVQGSLECVLYLHLTDTINNPKPGEAVLTSCLGGSSVSGLMLGTILRVELDTSKSEQTIIVSPNEKHSSLEEVYIVRGKESI
ncbi:MAG: rod shape-determining protein MreC [Eggerthellaceae bacterium]|nr:rod shape-determining protein MreC [Eggerthellaceae bacterium]